MPEHRASLVAGILLILAWPCSAGTSTEATPAEKRPDPPAGGERPGSRSDADDAEGKRPGVSARLRGDGAAVPAAQARHVSWEAGPPARVVLRGDVRVEYGGVRVEAAGAVLDEAAGTLYAEGPVRLLDDERGVRLTCESLSYNLRTHRGRANGARLVVKDPVPKPRAPGARGSIERGEVAAAVVEADVVTREGRGRFVAEEATVTSCEFADPHWRLRSRRVEVDLGDRVVSRGNTLFLGRAPVFHLPVFRMDISEGARPPELNLRAGSSGRWGEHARFEIGLPVARDDPSACELDMWGFSLGARRTRGWETGVGLEWKGDEAEGEARLDAFFEDAVSSADDDERATRDRAGAADKTGGVVLSQSASSYLASARGDPVFKPASVPSVPLDYFRHAGEARAFWEVSHVGALPHGGALAGEWEVESRVSAGSDRDVRYEYMERDAKTGLPEAAFVEARRRTPLSLVSVHSSFHVAPYRTETEYLPEVRWTAPATSLGGGVLLSAEAASGFLRRRHDEVFDFLPAVDASDYGAFRTRGRITLSRPVKLGPVNLSPYLGLDGSFYDYSDADDAFAERSLAVEDAVATGAAVYGLAASTRIFGNLREGDPAAAGDPPAGGRPLRHVIELRADYVGVSDPTHDPEALLGFDEADDLMESGRVRLAVVQRLQTKRADAEGVRRSHDLAGLLVGAEFFTDDDEALRLNSGRDWGPLRAVAFASPGPRFRLSGAFEWDLAQGAGDSTLRTSEAGIDFGSPPELLDDPARTYWRGALTHVSSDPPGTEPSTSELGLRLRVLPAGRWSFELSGRYELGDRPLSATETGPGWTDAGVSLVRDCHDWDLAFRIWRDPQDGDSGIGLSLRPRGYPLNIPRQ